MVFASRAWWNKKKQIYRPPLVEYINLPESKKILFTPTLQCSFPNERIGNADNNDNKYNYFVNWDISPYFNSQFCKFPNAVSRNRFQEFSSYYMFPGRQIGRHTKINRRILTTLCGNRDWKILMLCVRI